MLVLLCRHRTTQNVAIMCNTYIMHWECSGLKYPSADALSWSFACWYRDGTSKLSMRSSLDTVHNTFISVACKVSRFQAGWCGVCTCIPVGVKVCPFSVRPRPAAGPKKPPIEWAPMHFPDGKFTGPWSCSFTSKSKVKNRWIYNKCFPLTPSWPG
jgi:hypothetical protein